MSERAVKHDREEAARLFERGVGAARGGQKRVAASLLARAVQLDPRHEQAWLWLSGMLEDPNEIAFCLRSVLSINPNNERARQGLAWLEKRSQTSQPAAPVPVATAPTPEEPATTSRRKQQPQPDHEHWWVNWRRNRRETSRAWQIVLAGIIVLFSLTLGLNWLLRESLAQARAQNPAPAIAVLPNATAAPTVIPMLQTRLAPSTDAEVLAYLSVFDTQRETLRTATDAYREATSKLGNSSVLHASAARTLREQINGVRATIASLHPPAELQSAHEAYLSGLDEEGAAMDDMLQFYGSFQIQLANRAVLRLEEASQQIEQARTAFGVIQQQTNNTGIPPLTAR